MIKVNLGELPVDGLQLVGETRQDIFDLPVTDSDARPAGPLSYDLHVAEAGEDLLLALGSLRAPFNLRCVACLEEFPFTLKLDGYAAEFDVPASGVLDLTERIREDVLLELPAYPHCDRDGDDPTRKCPAAGLFDVKSDGEMGGSGSSAWGALDGFGKRGD